MLKELCDKRNIMTIWEYGEWEERREDIIRVLQNEEYGFMPKEHDSLSWEVAEEEKTFCAGKVTLRKVILTAMFGEDRFSFPIYASIPNSEGKHPFFVHINFGDAVPESEFLSCFAASEVYEKLGMKGLVSPDNLPKAGECFHDGNIGYHIRYGTHYQSREDWNKVMDFLEKK